MIDFRKKKHEVPALNTASLPDLIFSVLFFFIIVTHMRQDDVRVKYRVPQGKELARGFMLNYNWYRHYFPLTSLGRAEKYLETQR